MNRRFRLKYAAPLNSQRWKCNWINCAHGMGLAGMGRCSGLGWWWDKDCPGWCTEDEIEKWWDSKEINPFGIINMAKIKIECPCGEKDKYENDDIYLCIEFIDAFLRHHRDCKKSTDLNQNDR